MRQLAIECLIYTNFSNQEFFLPNNIFTLNKSIGGIIGMEPQLCGDNPSGIFKHSERHNSRIEEKEKKQKVLTKKQHRLGTPSSYEQQQRTKDPRSTANML